MIEFLNIGTKIELIKVNKKTMKIKIKKTNIKLTAILLLCAVGLSSFAILQKEETNVPTDTSVFKHRTMTNDAFTLGEKLNYRVHYGIINAANITMKIDDKFTNYKEKENYHINITGYTLKAFDWMFKVRDQFDSYVEKNRIAPMKFTKKVRENKYKDVDYAVFAPEQSKIYTQKAKGGSLKTKAGYTYDIASALLYTRNIDFSKAKVGDTYPINVYLDNTIYELSFRFDGRETIKSDVGKVKCIKLVPKLVVDRVFGEEEAMTVWVSDDKNKIPVRVKADLKVGSIKVDLTSYSGLKNTFSSKS